MIQDIAPHTLQNHWSPHTPEAGDFRLCFHEKQIQLTDKGTLPLMGTRETEPLYLFSFDGKACWLVKEPAIGGAWMTVREARYLPEGLGLVISTAWQLKGWYDSNRYCGHCGSPMEPGGSERSLVCPHCGMTVYPKIMPAVIIGLWNGERILMTRYAVSHSRFRGRALIAGFVEIGESAEDTVRREVKEEVGLSVRDIRYFASQPWGIASDLLLGYYCRLDHDEHISLEKDELESAEWVRRCDIDPATDTVSLTGTMIRYFMEHPEAFPA